MKACEFFYTASQAQSIDRFVIQGDVQLGYQLMEKAGEAAWQFIKHYFGSVRELLIFAGAGNNGGDGYVLARLAQAAGLGVTVVQLCPGDQLKHEAALAYQAAQGAGVPMLRFDASASKLPGTADLIVDALFGIGLSREVAGDYAQAISLINASVAPVFALDIPSGLCANTGSVLGCCVKAQSTLSFIVPKIGLVTGQGPDYVGVLECDALGVDASVIHQVAKGYRHLAPNTVVGLPPRHSTCHKGRVGHVLVIAGAQGMGGAALLAAEAALSAGAGKVSLLTHPDHVSPALARMPEVMVHGVEETDLSIVRARLAQANVVVIGPGLGMSPWAQALVKQVCVAMGEQEQLHLVLDADALNLLAKGGIVWREQWGSRSVMTPHPGEAARLLAATNFINQFPSVAAIESDRPQAIVSLVKAWKTTVVLKGAGSLVASPQGSEVDVSACTSGNPGMAVGGMGDVLSGLLGALLAQGLSAEQAAQLGVTAHATAADQLWDNAKVISVRPTELVARISRVLASLS